MCLYAQEIVFSVLVHVVPLQRVIEQVAHSRAAWSVRSCDGRRSMSPPAVVSVQPETDRAIEAGMDSCITRTDLGIGPCTVVSGVPLCHTSPVRPVPMHALAGLCPRDWPSADSRSVVDARDNSTRGICASLFANRVELSLHPNAARGA